jgi:hypothetical protein
MSIGKEEHVNSVFSSWPSDLFSLPFFKERRTWSVGRLGMTTCYATLFAEVSLRLDLQPRSLGQPALTLIEREKKPGTTFEGCRHVQKVDGSLPIFNSMLFAQVVGSSANIAPGNRYMQQKFTPEILLDLPERFPAILRRDQPLGFGEAKRVA